MVASESPSELGPLNKTTVSGEVKPASIYAQSGAEPPDRAESLPGSDRVQFTREPEESHAPVGYSRTTNSYLNEYIDILRKSEAEGLLSKGETMGNVEGSKEGLNQGNVKKKEGFDLFA